MSARKPSGALRMLRDGSCHPLSLGVGGGQGAEPGEEKG